ncbi:MAG: hypothetical protein AAGA35_01695 [Patescibacteria group bacterium]
MPGQDLAFQFVARFNEIILFPIIFLLSTVALFVFLWGGFLFVANANNETAREEGRRRMLWGIIGLLVMVSAYALLSVFAGTFGLGGNLQNCTTNTGSPCINLDR